MGRTLRTKIARLSANAASDGSRKWLTVDGGAVNSDGHWDEVDGLLDELVAAGRLLVLGTLVLGLLAVSLLGALLNVLGWEGSGRKGEGEDGDDAGELHFD